MWIRSEFGVLCNLAQATEVTVANGTVEVHYGKEITPLAHYANEAEAWKVFDRISQDLSDGKSFLDLSKHSNKETMSSETLISAAPGSADKAL